MVVGCRVRRGSRKQLEFGPHWLGRKWIEIEFRPAKLPQKSGREYITVTVMTFSCRKLLFSLSTALLLMVGHAVFAAEIPEPTPPLLAEAQRSLSRSKFDQALEQVNRYLSSAPKDVQGLFVKAVALSQTGKVEEAMALYGQINEDAPEMPEPYNNLAVLQAQRGQYDQARQTLEMAIRANPSYTVAIENLGDIYAKMALEQYLQAGKLDASNKALKRKQQTLETVITIPADQTGPRPLPAARKTSTVPF